MTRNWLPIDRSGFEFLLDAWLVCQLLIVLNITKTAYKSFYWFIPLKPPAYSLHESTESNASEEEFLSALKWMLTVSSFNRSCFK